MPGEAWFYHLTRRDAADTLRALLPRCLDAGWRVAVRSPDATRLAALDEALWLGSEDGFLPHGLAGGPHDAAQPVLLTAGAAANDPQVLMTLDGAELAPDELRALARACVIFDGRDGAAVERARAQWRALTQAGVAARYWSEESGRWEEVASSGR
jgi:DNA polymerase-3 subunit chi